MAPDTHDFESGIVRQALVALMLPRKEAKHSGCCESRHRFLRDHFLKHQADFPAGLKVPKNSSPSTFHLANATIIRKSDNGAVPR